MSVAEVKDLPTAAERLAEYRAAQDARHAGHLKSVKQSLPEPGTREAERERAETAAIAQACRQADEFIDFTATGEQLDWLLSFLGMAGGWSNSEPKLFLDEQCGVKGRFGIVAGRSFVQQCYHRLLELK
jgi:hypothetical protein